MMPPLGPRPGREKDVMGSQDALKRGQRGPERTTYEALHDRKGRGRGRRSGPTAGSVRPGKPLSN